MEPLLISCYLNKALCALKLQRYEDVLDATNAVLAMKSSTTEDQTKAYYRRGLAYYSMKDLDASLADYQKAAQRNPNDVTIKSEIHKVTIKLTEYREHEKKIYSKMFA
jgi:peptidyl-prolyl isomerase D